MRAAEPVMIGQTIGLTEAGMPWMAMDLAAWRSHTSHSEANRSQERSFSDSLGGLPRIPRVLFTAPSTFDIFAFLPDQPSDPHQMRVRISPSENELVG